MADRQWFLQLHSEILGPISHPELCDLARRGSVQTQSQISSDQTTWVSAQSVSDLVFGNVPHIESQPQPSTASFKTGTVLFWIFLFGLAVISGCVFVGIAIACLHLSPQTAGPNVIDEQNEPQSTSGQPTAEKTFEYWQVVVKAVGECDPAAIADPEKVVAIWRRAAAHLRSLPTRHVDQEALQCGLNVATMLSNLADSSEQNNGAAVFVNVFIRGAAGDPLGASQDMRDAESKLKQKIQLVQEEAHRTRAELSSRYGVEFPPLSL
jgi:hypothetical protein